MYNILVITSPSGETTCHHVVRDVCLEPDYSRSQIPHYASNEQLRRGRWQPQYYNVVRAATPFTLNVPNSRHICITHGYDVAIEGAFVYYEANWQMMD